MSKWKKSDFFDLISILIKKYKYNKLININMGKGNKKRGNQTLSSFRQPILSFPRHYFLYPIKIMIFVAKFFIVIPVVTTIFVVLGTN